MLVALYVRVSTSKQAEKDLSIPDQVKQIKDWCEREGHIIGATYEEPGASATDDRRPIFQQMVSEACSSPAPYEAIIVHSLSRFFRDSLEFGLYERQLNKHGVSVISITQQTSDDSAGFMARRIFSLFDEYQSKENSKHTLRAMKENARQGFFNGSRPPFGYRKKTVEQKGRKGQKKILEIDPSEADIVRRIFDLYINGQNGKIFGIAQIASYLNSTGTTRRGNKWSKSSVDDLLKNTAYIGRHYFNRFCAKTRQEKPEEDWVLVKVTPLIEGSAFSRAQTLREARSPKVTPPRIVNSPTLLTGLLRCSCGARMTLATGKSGRYRYYKCTRRTDQGRTSCNSRNLPMDRLDRIILAALADKVLTPARVRVMLSELRHNLKEVRSKHDASLRQLQQELNSVQAATERLYEAVENGFLPMDMSLKDRVHKHQARRQEILLSMASLRREQTISTQNFSSKRIESFCKAIREKLNDRSSQFGKEYLRLLVDEIKVDGNDIRLTGSYAALSSTLERTKAGHSQRVPAFGGDWLPNPDSNQGQGG